eukprot:364903-Chlamydomonas_euryale.AAC.9
MVLCCLFWLVYRPTSLRVLQASLRLLRVLSGQPQAAAVASDQGGTLYLMCTLLRDPHGPWPWSTETDPAGGGTADEAAAAKIGAQAAAAALLARLAAAPGHGTPVALVVQ